MDFMRLLKSFEEFLYEIVSWIVFYPVTMWRTIRHPSKLMRYADVELLDDDEDRYSDTLSPPLFLLVTLLIAHGMELGLLRQSVVLPSLLSTDANLLVFRAVSFSIFPLLMALKLLRHAGTQLDRKTLQPPFYSQCYVAAPFALGIDTGINLMRIGAHVPKLAGMAVLTLALIWYVTIETRWFRRDLGISTGRAIFMVVVTILEAAVVVMLSAAIIIYAAAPRAG
ncbi:MAG: permease [Phyllobacterium sp.]|uniref:permease n=1 Tax=Phyllobacterium sp. TaxID=1871046 RepID=UPI0030EFBA2D